MKCIISLSYKKAQCSFIGFILYSTCTLTPQDIVIKRQGNPDCLILTLGLRKMFWQQILLSFKRERLLEATEIGAQPHFSGLDRVLAVVMSRESENRKFITTGILLSSLLRHKLVGKKSQRSLRSILLSSSFPSRNTQQCIDLLGLDRRLWAINQEKYFIL